MDKPVATNSSSNAFNRGVDSASGTMHRAIDSASEAASPAIKNMAASAHSTVDKMASGANHAADAIITKSTQLQHLQQQLVTGTRAQIRNHPLLSLSVAIAGGALFSLWLSRRSVRKDAG
jgi:ElaB/YqjD/DUF883 family membrane-anchored ribosome-binding protein